ncbi:MAG: hypothetical protein NDJ94_20430 [Vicinamibacteria bacterium]|nr:hypothetical protein [Vicinamibacteria bacterium]
MTRFPKTWARPVAGAMALLLALTVATPLAAAEAPTPDPATAPVVAAAAPQTLAAAASAKVAAMNTNAALAPAQVAGGDDKPFFKSKKGVAAILLFVAGVGYTIYSAKEDRVSSPIR